LIWDAASGHVIHDLQPPPKWPRAVAWSPDGRRVAAGGSQSAGVWDADTGTQLLALPPERPSFFALAWSPAGVYLAARAFEDVIVWDAATGQEMLRVKASYSASEVCWSPSGLRLAVPDWEPWDEKRKEPTITIWGIPERKALTVLRIDSKGPQGVCFCA